MTIPCLFTYLYFLLYISVFDISFHHNAVGVTVVTLTSIQRRCSLGGQYSVFSGGYSGVGILCTIQGGAAQVSWGSSALIATSLLFIEPQVTKYQIHTHVRFFLFYEKR